MKIEKNWKISGVLLILLLVAEVLVWAAFTELDKKKLQSAIDETCSFSKIRIQEYEDYTANDRVKSLIRLLDKTKELSSNMEKLGLYGQKDLDDYKEKQRLTGVLILNEKLDLVRESTTKKGKAPKWDQLLTKDYIKDILDHPEETYTERIKKEDAEYDVAIVPRQDTEGLILAYTEKDQKVIGDMTLDSVFDDFPVSMDGVIAICLDGKIVSTNRDSFLGNEIEELRNFYKINTDQNNGWILSKSADQKVWYGGRDKMGEYAIYVFFPSSQIFMSRLIACVSYTAAAILVYLLVLLIQSNMERSVLK